MPETKEKLKKDLYEKILAAYGQAVKAYRKGDCAKAKELFKAFLEKHDTEKELVDRVHLYLALCENREKKETISLKTFEDYYEYAVYKLNQGDHGEAIKLLEKAKTQKPKEGKVSYLMALTYRHMEETEKCLENLKDAVHKDKFFGILAQNESGFEPLWEDKKFKIITKTG
ncbi:MAG: tetratricopeptide repeat protein [Candidatus Aminicenantes bacterium]|nr:MAG: tetratricopeptide repeat protein [Candidatus Aminicenantes bacterium]